jgi:SAM-dependent methyltransferase
VRRAFARPGAALPPDLRKVNLGYALWAATYDREPNPLLALEERVLEPRLPDVRHKTVLDVGCGTGRWLIRLLRRGARWGVGVDLSTEMLGCAASKCPHGAWLARADALALPLSAKTMDLIICSFTLSHIGNLPEMASELARVARKGTDVYLSGLHPDARARGWRCAFRNGAETVEIPEFHRPLEAVPRFFTAAGFEFASLLEPHFGSEERSIFVSGGKAEQFEAATTVPAVFVCHLRQR